MQGRSSPVQVKDPYTGSILMHVGPSCKHTIKHCQEFSLTPGPMLKPVTLANWQNEQNEMVKLANWQNEMVKLTNWQNEQNEMVKLANWQNEQNEKCLCRFSHSAGRMKW